MRRLAKNLAAYLALGVVRPIRDLWRTLTAGHPVRVFTFHRVTDICRDGMTVGPAVFRAQLAYVRRHHDVVPIEQAIALLRSGARLRRPVAAITFDDGYLSVFEAARPVMSEFRVPGCCYISTGLVGTDRRFEHDATHPLREQFGVMSWEQVRLLAEEGWSIGGHTVNHPRLSTLDRPTLERELAEPLEMIRARLGRTGISMAYPFGGRRDITPEGMRLAASLGYTACLSDYGGENFPATGTFHIQRIELGGNHPTLAWKSRTHGIDLGDWRVWWQRRLGRTVE
ncbi:MAG TPA: polysaccharide deacetylase family protein [Gemmatimonadales bacterium]|nr:polysaccharide deacetylase family protein [Gemmatimonadales bacterium]